VNLPVGAGKTKYAFVIGETAQEARQYIERAKAHPEATPIRYFTVSLSSRMAYTQLMGHKNCHIIVAGKVGRTYETHVNLQKVKEEARHRNTNWYYPPENSVMLKLHEGTTV